MRNVYSATNKAVAKAAAVLGSGRRPRPGLQGTEKLKAGPWVWPVPSSRGEPVCVSHGDLDRGVSSALPGGHLRTATTVRRGRGRVVPRPVLARPAPRLPGCLNPLHLWKPPGLWDGLPAPGGSSSAPSCGGPNTTAVLDRAATSALLLPGRGTLRAVMPWTPRAAVRRAQDGPSHTRRPPAPARPWGHADRCTDNGAASPLSAARGFRKGHTAGTTEAGAPSVIAPHAHLTCRGLPPATLSLR